MNNYSPRKLIDDFVQQFTDAAADETEKLDQSQMRALLESLLRKLNLVTREDFDSQAAVLARTRKRLQALEAQVADLEAKINE